MKTFSFHYFISHTAMGVGGNFAYCIKPRIMNGGWYKITLVESTDEGSFKL